MPSRERFVTTITIESDEERGEDVVVSESVEIQPVPKQQTESTAASTTSSDQSSTSNVGAATASPSPVKNKNAPRSQVRKRKELPPNQRTLGSFFVKGKSNGLSNKKSPSYSKTIGKKSDKSDTAGSPSLPVQKKAPLKDNASASVEPSSVVPGSAKHEKNLFAASSVSTPSLENISATPMADIMAIVLGAHGDSPFKSLPVPSKSIRKVRGVDVNTLLPSMVKPVMKVRSKKAIASHSNLKKKISHKADIKQTEEKTKIGATESLSAAGTKRKEPSLAQATDASSFSPITSNSDPSVNVLQGRKKAQQTVTEGIVDDISAQHPANELQASKKEKCTTSQMADDKSETIVVDSQSQSEGEGQEMAKEFLAAPSINQLQPRKKKLIITPSANIENDDDIQVVAVNQLQPRKKQKIAAVVKDAVKEKSDEEVSNEIKRSSEMISTSYKAQHQAVASKNSAPLLKKSILLEGKPLELSKEDSDLLSKYETTRNKYTSRATALIERAVGRSLPEEDFQKEAVEGNLSIPRAIISSEGKEVVEFKDEWVGKLSALVQGSPLSVDNLACVAQNKLICSLDENKFVSIESVASKIKLIATRTQHLLPVPHESTRTQIAKVDIFSDTNPEFMWRWELVSLDLLPDEYKATVKKIRAARRKLKNHEKAVIKLIQAISDVITSIKSSSSAAKKQNLIAKVSAEEEKVLKYEREEEKNRLLNEGKKLREKHKESAKKEKDEEKQRLEEGKRIEKQKTEEARKAGKTQKLEQRERKRKEVLEKKAQEETKQKSRMLSFFKKESTIPMKIEPKKIPAQVPVSVPVIKQSFFDSENFWSAIGSGNEISNPFVHTLSPQATRSKKRKVRTCNVRVFVATVSDNPFEQQVYDEEKTLPIRNRYKFLSFREDFRPPYHGTWSKPVSALITGRNPSAKDTAYLDYDVDSEIEWEDGDDEQGEDCSENGNDDEDMVDDEEGDITKYNYQDGWLAEDCDLKFEDDNEDTQELSKRKMKGNNDAVGVDLKPKLIAACVIAPLKGGIPQAFACPNLASECVEGIEITEAQCLLKLHNSENLSSLSISLDPFPPLSKKASAKKAEALSSQKSSSNEMSRDDLIKFTKFVHNSNLKSKDMVIEELRNTHSDITSSRAQATRKLDSIANKRRLKNGGGVIWEVKNEILESLGLHDLVKTEQAEEEKPEVKKTKTAKDTKIKTANHSQDSEAGNHVSTPTKNKKTLKAKTNAEYSTAPMTKKSNNPKGTSAKPPTSAPTKTKKKATTVNAKKESSTTAAIIETPSKAKLEDASTTCPSSKKADTPALVSPSVVVENKKAAEATSPSRKRKAAPVSKASMNLLASFLKKKKHSA